MYKFFSILIISLFLNNILVSQANDVNLNQSRVVVSTQDIKFDKKISDYNLYSCNNKKIKFTIFNGSKGDLINNKENKSRSIYLKNDSLVAIYLKNYKKTYYFRCLPDDFPIIKLSNTKNKLTGFLALPYYSRTLSGNTFSSNYFIITDTYGGVLWYQRSSGGSTTLDLLNKNTIITRGVMNGFHPGTPTKYNSVKLNNLENNFENNLTINDYLSRPTSLLSNGDILVAGSPNRSGVDISKYNITLQDQSNGLCVIDKTNVNIAGVSIIEIDPDGVVKKELDLTDKIPFTASSKANIINRALLNQPPDCAIDIFHQNSLTESEDKKGYILSNRWSGVFYIDKISGEILWHIGGYKSELSLEIINDPLGSKGPVAQHGGYLTKDNRLFIFDNQVEKSILARGVEYYIDLQNKKAIFIRSFNLGIDFCVESIGIFTCNSTSQGNIEIIDKKGNTLVSWGNTDGREEIASIFTKDGKIITTLSILSPKPNVFAVKYINSSLLDKNILRRSASSNKVINNGIYPLDK